MAHLIGTERTAANLAAYIKGLHDAVAEDDAAEGMTAEEYREAYNEDEEDNAPLSLVQAVMETIGIQPAPPQDPPLVKTVKQLERVGWVDYGRIMTRGNPPEYALIDMGGHIHTQTADPFADMPAPPEEFARYEDLPEDLKRQAKESIPATNGLQSKVDRIALFEGLRAVRADLAQVRGDCTQTRHLAETIDERVKRIERERIS